MKNGKKYKRNILLLVASIETERKSNVVKPLIRENAMSKTL